MADKFGTSLENKFTGCTGLDPLLLDACLQAPNTATKKAILRVSLSTARTATHDFLGGKGES